MAHAVHRQVPARRTRERAPLRRLVRDETRRAGAQTLGCRRARRDARPRRRRASKTRSRSAPTLAEAAERWRASRVDVTDGTAVGHRVQLARVLPLLGSRRVDEITPSDVADARRRAPRRRAASARRSARASPPSPRCSTSPASRRTRRATASTCGCRARSARSRPRRPPIRSRPCSRLMPRRVCARRARARRDGHARRRTRGEGTALRRPRRAEHTLAHSPRRREGPPRALGLARRPTCSPPSSRRSRRARTACPIGRSSPG